MITTIFRNTPLDNQGGVYWEGPLPTCMAGNQPPLKKVFNTLAPNPLKLWFSYLGIFEKFRFCADVSRKNSDPFRAFKAANDSTHDYSILPQTVSEKPHQVPVTSKITAQPPIGGVGAHRDRYPFVGARGVLGVRVLICIATSNPLDGDIIDELVLLNRNRGSRQGRDTGKLANECGMRE